MASIAELLHYVVGAGQTVTLVYNAGSRPGEARLVIPVSVSDGALVAGEPGSRINKTYRLDRIQSVVLANGLSATNEQAVSPSALPHPDIPVLATLAEYVDYFRPELVHAGWHLYEELDTLGLATRFKNGKPKKTPSVLLRHFDRSTQSILNLNTKEWETVPREETGRERPWRVDSWRFKEGKTFREIERAIEVFIAEARASNPEDAKSLWAGH